MWNVMTLESILPKGCRVPNKRLRTVLQTRIQIFANPANRTQIFVENVEDNVRIFWIDFLRFIVKWDGIARNAGKKVSLSKQDRPRRSVFRNGTYWQYDATYLITVYFQHIPLSHHISHKRKLFRWETYSFSLKFSTIIRVQFRIRYFAFSIEWRDYDNSPCKISLL